MMMNNYELASRLQKAGARDWVMQQAIYLQWMLSERGPSDLSRDLRATVLTQLEARRKAA